MEVLWSVCLECVYVYLKICVFSQPREQSSGIKPSSCPKGKSRPERAYLWNKTTLKKDVLQQIKLTLFTV